MKDEPRSNDPRWQCEQKLAKFGYGEREENIAFKDGYAAGFADKARDLGHAFPNAYARGYWEGVADSSPYTEGDAGEHQVVLDAHNSGEEE